MYRRANRSKPTRTAPKYNKRVKVKVNGNEIKTSSTKPYKRPRNQFKDQIGDYNNG